METMEAVVLIAGRPSVVAVSVARALKLRSRVRILSKHIDVWERRVGGFNEEIGVWSGERLEHVFIFWDPDIKWYEKALGRGLIGEAKKVYIADHDVRNFPKDVSGDSTLIVLGDLFGPFVSFEHSNEISQLLSSALQGKVEGSKNYYVYPVYVDNAVESIVKIAFGFEGQRRVIVGTRMDSLTFCDLVVTADGGGSIEVIQSEASGDGFGFHGDFDQVGDSVDEAAIAHTLAMASIEEIPRSFLTKEIPQGLVAMRETAEIPAEKEIDKPREEQYLVSSFNPKHFFVSVFIGVFLMILPFLTLIGSGASYFTSYGMLRDGNTRYARPGLFIGGALADFSAAYFGLVGKVVPIDGLLALAENMSRLEEVGGRGMVVYENFLLLASGVVGEDYDLQRVSASLAAELESIYKETSFLESEFAELGVLGGFMPSKNVAIDARADLLTASRFASRMPELLGGEGTRTYMVLLQNNAELRPTGGFIGSFALVSLVEGRLADAEVFDVYSADGQLKGFVAPPYPIEAYLGEPAWYLRDSNWDPDFEASAQRAEWFLDKSIDRQVDGVIGVNMGTIERLIGEIGPLKIEGYGEEVDASNLYEVVQYEVENDFFPGSRKKATYLTSLQNSLMDKVYNLSPKEYFDVGRLVLAELDSREVQIFLHDKETYETTKVAGWSGTIGSTGCGENCKTLTTGLFEANLGVNKVNRFIDREIFWSLEIIEQAIVSKMRVALINNSRDTGDYGKDRYKTYLRVASDEVEETGGVQVVRDGVVTEIAPEVFEVDGREEMGVIVEVLPGESVDVVFNWIAESGVDFGSGGKIALRTIKQSGVNPYPLNIEVQSSTGRLWSDTPGLTHEPTLNYNTTLTGEDTLNIFKLNE